MKISPIKNRSTTTTHKWVDIMGRYVTTHCNRVSKKPNPKMGEWPSPDGKRCNEWPWQMNFEAPEDDLHNFSWGHDGFPEFPEGNIKKQNHHVSFVKSEPIHRIRCAESWVCGIGTSTVCSTCSWRTRVWVIILGTCTITSCVRKLIYPAW